MSRRSALSAVPLIALGGFATVRAVPAAAAAMSNPAAETIQLVATQVRSNFPATPGVGATFAMALALFDTQGKTIGDGSVTGSVVSVTADTPPKFVVQSAVVLRLTDKGELHLSTMHVRVVPSPVANPAAITGGTGAYANARGDGTISYPDPDKVTISLTVTTG